MLGSMAAKHDRPVLYVNQAGGNDDLVFDGRSSAFNAAGALVARGRAFATDVVIVDLDASTPLEPAPDRPVEADIWDALVVGTRDYVRKCGFSSVVLGLSGGVDSALAACIAAAAVGPAAVTALALPSRHTDPRSTGSARELAESLGIGFETLPIEPLHAAAETALSPFLDGTGTTDENLQARLRSLVLNAYVNRHGGLLLNTSNKTEISLGYGTLHGDLAGTLSVLGDLTKPEVYGVARWYAAQRGPIPAFILERAPTAELRQGQVDPFDYPVVAPAVEALVRGLPSADPEAGLWRRRLRAAEFKRWQHGVILKVSERAFGTGRMVPITRVEE
jgi:NAD+ synthetase